MTCPQDVQVEMFRRHIILNNAYASTSLIYDINFIRAKVTQLLSINPGT